MALQSDILRARLKEAFGAAPQEVTALKLNMSQGNTSKIVAGQQPDQDMIYHIAEEYDVSVDWLLGLSDKKRITKSTSEPSNSSTVKAIHDLCCHGTVVIDAPEKSGKVTIETYDSMLVYLLKKRNALYKADRELFLTWMETRLSIFENKGVLYSNVWTTEI